jgi:hypothetical protein
VGGPVSAVTAGAAARPVRGGSAGSWHRHRGRRWPATTTRCSGSDVSDPAMALPPAPAHLGPAPQDRAPRSHVCRGPAPLVRHGPCRSRSSRAPALRDRHAPRPA